MEFDILVKEFRRRTKNGHSNFFCSRSCSSTHRNKHRTITEAEKDRLRGLSAAAVEKARIVNTKLYNEFNYYIRKAKNRTNHKNDWASMNIDNTYLKELWDSIDGKCYYSGLPMTLASNDVRKKNDIFKMASLDRIDSSIGYVKGNVQFCIAALNYAKNDRSDQDFREFITFFKGSL